MTWRDGSVVREKCMGRRSQRLKIPLALSAESWLHLRSHLNVYEIKRGVDKAVWRPKPSFLMPLNAPVSLIYHRSEEPFGQRINQGVLWPLQVRRYGILTTHIRRPIQVGLLLEETVQKVMVFSAELRTFLLRQLLAAQNDAVEMLVKSTGTSALKRVSYMLLRLDEESGGAAICCSHQALGFLTNLRRETVTIALRDLRQLGLIHARYRYIIVCDRKRLGMMLECK